MTKHANSRQRSRSRQGLRSRQGSVDKIWAVGLAGATCVGLVGTLGVRAATDAAAEPAPQDSAQLVLTTTAQTPADAQAVSSSGLTEAQLDDYALALEAERARLEDYHAQLLDVAAQLQASADAIAQSRAQRQATLPPSKPASAKSSTPSKPASAKSSTPRKPAPKPVAKPVPKPAAVPQVATPQAQTRGS